VRGAWPILAIALGTQSAVAREPVALLPVVLGQLRVTEGTIEPLASGALTISSPKVRAVLLNATKQSVELRFRFLGRSEAIARLDDGEARAQLGLKLGAKDSCNVLYVMWRVEPRSELAVQLKRNPGQSLSSQCGARGYRKLPVAVPLPRLEPNAAHTLRADLEADQLSVRVDGALVWQGSIGDPLPLEGPVGMRTDNVRLEFRLAAGGERASAGASR
jgi:hypothetical protein